ncbi:PLP-dependent aminotransferase family protein [Xanthobacter dioxanivorans]|uniref:PLP-dependent aminotransferase family protein n=1 Tax=Xanthobacter dioxanivorans TaxID=2528964 RepID=A0A974PQA0_9HYPH|nr:PLP-dependent aminotransferase family protein [Xanthobacter dioxanivorans]QRG07768.1 PLP-dependent aminotransferase family protein [Xanthobacter dioxanivorans]
MLISLDRSSSSSLQEQLFEQIRQQILDGRLKGEASVPSSRHLAQQLGISRNSVTFAYERLINEGYLITRPMVGTYVAAVLPERAMSPAGGAAEAPAPSERRSPEKLAPAAFTGRSHAILNNSRIPIDFWPQRTDPRAFPLKTWRRLILHALAVAGHNLTEYGDPCGLMALRAAIADHVAVMRDIHVRPEQVVIVAGAQLALNLALRVLAREGDTIVIENPCSQGAAYLFESVNMRLCPIAADEDGIDTAQLARVAAQIAYVMPSHQYPMGGVLSLERRKTILEWADRTGAYIIEDDYDNEFHYGGMLLPALKAMSPENVIYLGTFSKSLGAGLRTGYAIFPDHLAPAAGAAKALLDNGQVWLEQAALAEFLLTGGFVRHLRRVRLRYQQRRNAIVAALRQHFGRVDLRGTEAGTHLAWKLPAGLPRAHQVAALARSQNVGVYTIQSGGGHEYGNADVSNDWLLLGYASLAEDQIEAGISRLKSRL